MRYFYLVAFISTILFSCKNGNTDQQLITKDSGETQVATNANDISYPSLTKEIIKDLAMNCDFVDYIFYDLPISISQDDKKAIVSNINFISKEVPTRIPPGCKAMGRKSFMQNGEILIEADIYLNKEEGCYLYVFYKDGKKAYANNISSDGVNFYFNVFNQAGIK